MPAPLRSDDPAFGELMVSSYARLVGDHLPPLGAQSGVKAAQWLHEAAPFGLLLHETSPGPVFIYANRAAQRAFEYSWEEFVGMPYRLSVQTLNRTKRQEFMDEVRRRGFGENYRGQRIAKSGRTFWIEETTVWNLIDDNGGMHGQAALIRRTAG
jgi:PAS domain S-box-containing protein